MAGPNPFAAGPPAYTAGQIEQIAGRILGAAFPDGIAVPVDIDYLIECEPDVSLDTMRGLKESCGVAGAVVAHPAEGRLTVLIDEDVADGPPPFYRFTLAEEFGHVTLHRAVLKEIRSLEQVIELHRSRAYYDIMDRNAKRFAAAILMPPDPLRRHADEMFTALRAAHVRDTGIMPALVVRLGQRYAVSTAAMRFRLGEWPVGVADAVRVALVRGLPVLFPG